MLIKKIALSTAIVLLIVTPLVYFTNTLASIPYLGPILTKGFWKALISNPETTGPADVPIIVFAGPACIIFMLFWNLWVQRNKWEIMLVVSASATDIHKWLGMWAQTTEQQLAGDIKTVGPRAKKLLKKLDHLLSLENREGRRFWDSLHLAIFYTFNAQKLSAFKEVKVEPPPGYVADT